MSRTTIPPNPDTRKWEIWEYELMGRVFIIDPTIGDESNICNAVLEIEPMHIRPLPGEHHHDTKVRICKEKRVIAETMIRALRCMEAQDAYQEKHGYPVE